MTALNDADLYGHLNLSRFSWGWRKVKIPYGDYPENWAFSDLCLVGVYKLGDSVCYGCGEVGEYFIMELMYLLNNIMLDVGDDLSNMWCKMKKVWYCESI